MKLPSWRVWVGLLLIIAACIGSQWAVQKYTKPGHMSVLEAQGADMTGMKPPVGAIPVAAMIVRRRSMEATVRYAGTAVAFLDQDVSARVPGTILWMPAYPGMVVHRGQTLARLDTRELNSKVNEQSAAVAMSQHATAIARIQYRQALSLSAQAGAQFAEAQNDVATAQSEFVSANQDVTAAQEERVSAQADLESAQAGIADATAQRTSAQADQTYWSLQIQRAQTLLTAGVISQKQFQQDQNQAANADAKMAQAQAHLEQARSAVRGVEGRVKKTDAMIASAQAKVVQAQSRIQGSQTRVQQMQANRDALTAAADAARHEIAHTGAGEQQTEAQLATARTVASYTEIKAEIDGVVTQRLISPGTLVQPGQSLLKISQIGPIRLQANVAENDVSHIRIGSRVRVSTIKNPQHPVFARVSALFPASDPSSRTSVVEAVVPNQDHHFLPGDYLTMEISTGNAPNALTVPADSLISQPKATGPTLAIAETQAVWVIVAGQTERTIYTCTMHPEIMQDHPGDCPKCKMPLTPMAVGGKWRAHLVPIITGLVNTQNVEVKSGLAEGDQVLYAGYEGLHEGDPVVPTEWGTSGPLALPPAAGEAPSGTLYTCPMHPEVKSDHPGDCPKCGMHLVPIASGGSSARISERGGAR